MSYRKPTPDAEALARKDELLAVAHERARRTHRRRIRAAFRGKQPRVRSVLSR